ncbi:MAG: site-2 protease family protein, partial [Symploca sp. SIO2E6]|nr:site-2 protease family protein [Symploca sp. SIO2E6]
MFNGSETTATILLILLALGVLAWGFKRAQPYGKLGILAWLQSVVLTIPWLLFFGLLAAGIYFNIVSILFLIVVSTGLYIYLGKLLRAAGEDEVLRKPAKKNQQPASNTETSAAEDTTTATNSPPPSQSKNATTEIAPIPDEDLKSIQEIFAIDTFFSTETIPYQEGVIFKGNLRGKEPETVYSRLAANLEKRLGDRYRLFLVEGPEGKPVVIVLPSSNDPQPATVSQKILAGVLFLVTIATTLEAASLLLKFDFFEHLERFAEALPISIGIGTVL